jgi:PAS domain S-box-containing protein
VDEKYTDSQELAILKGAVENTNEAFVTIDENHRVTFYNQAAEKIFGFRREEVVGKDLNMILSPQCSGNHRQAVQRYLETKIPRRIDHQTELIATRKNGEIFTPFFTTKERGTGLGLPICKRIIESHPGSSIEIISEERKGTEVKLTLPRYEPAN